MINFQRYENKVMYETLQNKIDSLKKSKWKHQLDDNYLEVWEEIQKRIIKSDEKFLVFKR